MQKAVYIFGSGGHTRSLISLLKQCDFKILGIFDNTFNTQEKELINNITATIKPYIPYTTY